MSGASAGEPPIGTLMLSAAWRAGVFALFSDTAASAEHVLYNRNDIDNWVRTHEVRRRTQLTNHVPVCVCVSDVIGVTFVSCEHISQNFFKNVFRVYISII